MPRDHRGLGHLEEPMPGSGNWHFTRPQPYRPSAYRGNTKDAAARTGREMPKGMRMVPRVREGGAFTSKTSCIRFC